MTLEHSQPDSDRQDEMVWKKHIDRAKLPLGVVLTHPPTLVRSLPHSGKFCNGGLVLEQCSKHDLASQQLPVIAPTFFPLARVSQAWYAVHESSMEVTLPPNKARASQAWYAVHDRTMEMTFPSLARPSQAWYAVHESFMRVTLPPLARVSQASDAVHESSMEVTFPPL